MYIFPWSTPNQKISSNKTSNNRSKLPAVFTKIDWDNYPNGSHVLDIGSGIFLSHIYEYINSRLGHFSYYPYDPYNLPLWQNGQAQCECSDHKASIVVISNVLNVIREPQERHRVLTTAANALMGNGSVYITVYEGNRSGQSNKTSKGWQNNKKLAGYVSEVHACFYDVEMRNKMIVASNPRPTNLMFEE